MVRQSVTPEPNGKIRCDACPVLCYIKDGRTGACDRYANDGGDLVRVDPFTLMQHMQQDGARQVVEFLRPSTADANASTADSDDQKSNTDDPAIESEPWDGQWLQQAKPFVTAIGAGTTYPDYKPAPFIVSQVVDDVDMVTVVTEGIFSYCGVKIKIDTDRHLGPEQATVRVNGEAVGHVTTGEYGSQMLSLGGVNHLTGGTKKEGRITCETLLELCNRAAVTMSVDDGAEVVVQAGQAPVVNGVTEHVMRVGCGSATIGMFARQWQPYVDEVVVVDDHITGVLSEHQAGRMLGMEPSGIKIRGRRSTPGRYFQVAEPGSGWGGTDISDPLSLIDGFKADTAKPGFRLLMISTTGEQHAYYVLDAAMNLCAAELPAQLKPSVDRIAENCEPSLCTVLFIGGAGGSLRAGVTENPVRLTQSIQHRLTRVTCGGAPVYRWPGGGITIMADVLDMPRNAFGYVPTPALVAPIEFSLRREDFIDLGGYAESIVAMESVASEFDRAVVNDTDIPWALDKTLYKWS